MSWSASDWASKQQTGSGHCKLVLICLANFADEHNECFPSYKTLGKMTELSKSTIIRCIKQLQEKNIISVKERYTNINDGARQTSNLYTLNIQNETVGYQNDTHPLPSVKPHITNHKEPNIYTKEFEEFWKIYPNNSGSKRKAFESYNKAVHVKKKIDEDMLLNICKKFSNNMMGKDIKYIPHCTTWLNQERWETVVVFEKEKTNLNQLVG